MSDLMLARHPHLQRDRAQISPSEQYDSAVSAFIDSFWKAHCCSPTIREIQEGCAISSTSVTRYVVLRVTKARGDMLAKDGQARGIVPVWVRNAIANAKVR